jgi:hypothetical protein
VTRAFFDRVGGPTPVGFRPPAIDSPGRRVLLGLAVLFGLAVIVMGLVGMTAKRHGRTDPPTATQAPPVGAPAQIPAINPAAPGSGLSWHTPATLVPSGSPVQEQYDQAFSEGLGSLSGMAAAQTLRLPPPAVAGGWPALPVQVTPERWAASFTSGLLTIDYAHQPRSALTNWLQAQEAPELIPGVPSSVADKVLSISLLDPEIFGGQPTPVVSDSAWAARARAGASQTVSDVIVQPDPGWAEMTAAGWQPADVRMTEEDASGLVSLHQSGRTTTHRFALQLIVGSARWHDGYGTVAVSSWQEQ